MNDIRIFHKLYENATGGNILSLDFLFSRSKDENANIGISVRMWKTRFSSDRSQIQLGTISHHIVTSKSNSHPFRHLCKIPVQFSILITSSLYNNVIASTSLNNFQVDFFCFRVPFTVW